MKQINLERTATYKDATRLAFGEANFGIYVNIYEKDGRVGTVDISEPVLLRQDEADEWADLYLTYLTI